MKSTTPDKSLCVLSLPFQSDMSPVRLTVNYLGRPRTFSGLTSTETEFIRVTLHIFAIHKMQHSRSERQRTLSKCVSTRTNYNLFPHRPQLNYKSGGGQKTIMNELHSEGINISSYLQNPLSKTIKKRDPCLHTGTPAQK